jgi:hypothetical protein
MFARFKYSPYICTVKIQQGVKSRPTKAAIIMPPLLGNKVHAAPREVVDNTLKGSTCWSLDSA